MSNCDNGCGVKRVSSKKKAGRLDLHIEQGATFSIPIVYKIDGLPVDLTDVRVRAQFRRIAGSKDTVFSFDSDEGDFVITPLEGKIVLTILPNQTKNITIYEGVWDMELTWSEDNIVRLLQGKFFIDREVTV